VSAGDAGSSRHEFLCTGGARNSPKHVHTPYVTSSHRIAWQAWRCAAGLKFSAAIAKSLELQSEARLGFWNIVPGFSRSSSTTGGDYWLGFALDPDNHATNVLVFWGMGA
jgi:hypothetical protein